MKQKFLILISVFFMLQVAINLQADQATKIARIVEIVKALPKNSAHHPVQPAYLPAPVMQGAGWVDAFTNWLGAITGQAVPTPQEPKVVAKEQPKQLPVFEEICFFCRDELRDIVGDIYRMNCCPNFICATCLDELQRAEAMVPDYQSAKCPVCRKPYQDPVTKQNVRVAQGTKVDRRLSHGFRPAPKNQV